MVLQPNCTPLLLLPGLPSPSPSPFVFLLGLEIAFPDHNRTLAISMASPGTREVHAQFLSERSQVIKSHLPDGIVPRTTFTFATPHICSYCKEIILGDPICINQMEYLPLGCSTSDSISAALNGCNFHQWIVDLCSDYFGWRNGDLEHLEEPLWLRLPASDPELPWAGESHAGLAIIRAGWTYPITCVPSVGTENIFICSRRGE